MSYRIYRVPHVPRFKPFPPSEMMPLVLHMFPFPPTLSCLMWRLRQGFCFVRNVFEGSSLITSIKQDLNFTDHYSSQSVVPHSDYIHCPALVYPHTYYAERLLFIILANRCATLLAPGKRHRIRGGASPGCIRSPCRARQYIVYHKGSVVIP